MFNYLCDAGFCFKQTRMTQTKPLDKTQQEIDPLVQRMNPVFRDPHAGSHTQFAWLVRLQNFTLWERIRQLSDAAVFMNTKFGAFVWILDLTCHGHLVGGN